MKQRTIVLTELQIKLLKEMISICDGLAFIVEDNLEDEMDDLKKQLGE